MLAARQLGLAAVPVIELGHLSESQKRAYAPHLNTAAAAEWRRIAKTLQQHGVLTTIDRAALAAYCQGYARWVEAEEKLKETPALIKTPWAMCSSRPWLTSPTSSSSSWAAT